MYSNLSDVAPERVEQAAQHAGGPGGPGLGAVVTRARRRAVRAGDAEIDTGHLLHALLESDDRVLGLAAPLPAQATRLMGYLAQRSIGFGRHWGSGEGENALGAVLPSLPGWSRSAAAALARVGPSARIRTGGHPEALDLLGELAADPSCRAAAILQGAGVDPLVVALRVRSVCPSDEPAPSP
ncbi:Clp protease N-terminal domain-containing protein [Streptacidiphilus sp. EB129]|uniref:Clp protease N-terminal domain-containing protein n=1 Tax=Streptacidiphilus sp. EB129 TaxID=3156262 RepID=UPI003513C588